MVPIVACLPHGGVDFPADLAADLAVSPDILWSDWLTRELYAFLPELGITTITTSLSRFVADVNRDPNGEQHGAFWSSVVAARLPDGQPVYRRALSPAEIRHRIRIAHEPFQQALDVTAERLLRQFPQVLLLDLHSFGVPLDGDAIQVELNQCRYLNLNGHSYPAPPPTGAFETTQQLLRTALANEVAEPLLALFQP